MSEQCLADIENAVSPGLTPRPSLNEGASPVTARDPDLGVAGANPPALIERPAGQRPVNRGIGVAGANPPALIER